jgi:Domain of Unknown Function (DUF1080)
MILLCLKIIMKNKFSLWLVAGSMLLTLNAAAVETSAHTNWVSLLDAKLTRWELWMGVPHESVQGLPAGTPTSTNGHNGQPLGLGNDPKKVFSMIEQDGQPVLKITGEIFGGLTTLSEYENFHLSLQVKFGERQWAPRENSKRDSGVLYHCTGRHGAFWNVWMRCVECQVQETDIGDLFLLAGTDGDVRTFCRTNFAATPTEVLAKTNPPTVTRTWDVMQPAASGNSVSRSANFENPHGEWTTVEVYAVGRQAVHVVNGHVVLAIHNIRLKNGTPLSQGKIQIQSEGAEVYYRDVKVQTITDFPKTIRESSGLARLPE